MARDGSIFLHIGVTLYETIVSFLLVIAISVLMAVALWLCPKLSEILDPYMVVLNSPAKIRPGPSPHCLAGSHHYYQSLWAGMSVAIFAASLNLYTAFRTVEPEEDQTDLYPPRYPAPGPHKGGHPPVPSPLSCSTMKVNIGLCLVGVIIGEFLAARQGLGYLIIYASQTFKLDWLLMSIVPPVPHGHAPLRCHQSSRAALPQADV